MSSSLTRSAMTASSATSSSLRALSTTAVAPALNRTNLASHSSSSLDLPPHILENIGHGLQLKPWSFPNHPTKRAYSAAPGTTIPASLREGLGHGIPRSIPHLAKTVQYGFNEVGPHLGARRSTVVDELLSKGVKGFECKGMVEDDLKFMH